MPMKDGRKVVVFWLILTSITLLSCELGARLVFAFMVGPKVLLYGTGAYRNEVKLFPSVVMMKIGYTPPTPEHYKIWTSNSFYTKFSPNEYKTDRDEHGERFHPTINSRGFRGKEFSDKKLPGVIRVVTLGASSTFGYHNREHETYPYYMEALLNAAANGEKTFEVINLGIPHMHSDQILSIFLNEALALEPDVVTFYEGWNDAGASPDTSNGEGLASVFGHAYAAAREYVLMIALFDSLFYYIGGSSFTSEKVQNIIKINSENFLANVSIISEECKKRGILFIIATQQACSQFIQREGLKGIKFHDEVITVERKLKNKDGLRRREVSFLIHAGIMEALERWAPANNIAFVDVIRATDADRDVLLTYVHPSPQGNRMIAQEFVKEILKHL